MATFDTHSSVKTLIASGMSEPEAEAVTGLLYQSRETDFAGLATKSDLAETRVSLLHEIGSVRTELKAELREEIASVRTELGEVKAELRGEIVQIGADVAQTRADLAQTRADLRGDLAETKADILKWMIGMVGGAVVINAATVIGAMLALVRLMGH